MRDTLGSGLTLDRAFQGLASNGPDALRPAFRQFEAELPPHTDSFETAAMRLRDRLADSTWDLVTAGLLLHDEVGSARFGACLDHLAALRPGTAGSACRRPRAHRTDCQSHGRAAGHPAVAGPLV